MEIRDPDIAFTRNPIRFTGTGQSGETRMFTVKVGGATAYSGRYVPPAVIDVAEIAEAFVAPIQSPKETASDDSGLLLEIEDATEFEKRLVTVTDDDGEPLMPAFYALPGGVSPQNFRRLRELDTDIFAARLLDKKHNFFLTTRTHGWSIVMDELEVFPLTFVNLTPSATDEDSEIEVKATGTLFSVSMDNNDKGIYAIDIGKIRMKIAEENGFLGSVFDVLCDGYLACRIVIRESLPELETTLVKFRNSLGVFELLHLSGQKESGVAPKESEQDGKRYDSISGRYVNISQRKALTRSLEISTGFRTDDEIRFIQDMAVSEEVYLQENTGWVRVTPSINKLQLASPQRKPESIKVTFTVADEYDNQTPDINDLKDFERPRIFSEQHSDEFN